MTTKITPYEIAVLSANLVDQRKGKDIIVLKTEQVSSISDYFIIASVDSRTQMMALADHLVKALKQHHLSPLNQDIDKAGRWTLLDYGDIVIHLFHHADRDYYNLERFWNHATEIPQSQWLKEEKQAS